jgi:hypothetical protein
MSPERGRRREEAGGEFQDSGFKFEANLKLGTENFELLIPGLVTSAT